MGRRGTGWYYRLELPAGPDGRRRQNRVSGFRTEREARAALARASVAVTEGWLRYTPTRTVAELAGEWVDAVEPNRKASTAANYAMLVRSYIVPGLGAKRLDRLTPAEIQRFYGDLRRAGGQGGRSLSGTHVRNIHRVLHNLLNFARRMGYLAINPADAVEKPRDDTAERPVYSPEEVRRFVAAAADDRLGALWHLVVTTGLRRAELAGLQWRDVSLDGSPPQLVVRLARTTAGQQVVETEPRTKAGKRSIVLDGRTVEVLRAHAVLMLDEAAVVGRKSLSPYVFVDEVREPLHPVRITRLLHAFQHRIGLPEITLHDLRHTSATVALLAGVHPKVVSERHGHASTRITLDRYSPVLESMQVSAADAIGRFLDPA